MDRKFIVVLQRGGSSSSYLAHVEGNIKNPYLMTEEEALDRLAATNTPARVFEVTERSVETKRVIV